MDDKYYIDYLKLVENKDAFIINRNEYNNGKEFLDYCKNVIIKRIEDINRNNIYDFSECLNSDLIEIQRLKEIYIYLGIKEWDLEYEFYLITEDLDLNYSILKNRYGIEIITEGIIIDYYLSIKNK